MSLLDSPMRSVAKTLINLFGGSVTIQRRVPGTYDPIAGTEGAETTTTHPVKASPPEPFATDRIDGTSILTTDLRMLLAAQSAPVVPDPKTDSVILDGVTYKLIRTSPIKSGDLVAAWELHLRI